MKKIGTLNTEGLIKLTNLLGVPAVGIYTFCMIIWPWISGGGNWGYVQNIWDRWQSLNVGMLALFSSITAFNISRYNAEKQRQRDFFASKAFLPEALSELVSYLNASAEVFKLGWASGRGCGPHFDTPELPREYKIVFGECIRHAEPQVGDYLSQILVWLQVHDARMKNYVKQRGGEDCFDPDRYSLITYFYRLGELQALINKIFDFARNMEEFDDSPLSWEEFRNAYRNLDIWIDDVRVDDQMNLEEFTKRAIAANDGKRT